MGTEKIELISFRTVWSYLNNLKKSVDVLGFYEMTDFQKKLFWCRVRVLPEQRERPERYPGAQRIPGRDQAAQSSTQEGERRSETLLNQQVKLLIAY